MESLAGDDRPAFLISSIKPVQYDAARPDEPGQRRLLPGNDIPHKRTDHCGNRKLQMKPIYGVYGPGNLTMEYW